jgi:DNA-binding NtrC family response regulator
MIRTGLLGTDAGGQLVLRRVRVRVVSGDDVGREVMLEGGTLVIGSHADVELTLRDHTVSRYHAELGLLGEGVRVRDLGSTNGTFVGTARIEGMVLVPPAELRVGRTRIELLPADLPAPEAPGERTEFGPLVGQSPAMRRLFALLERVAVSDAPLVLEGEAGTGKSLAARAVHDASPRAQRPFVVLELASCIDASAVQRAFDAARSGTLVLDRLDEASAHIAEAVAAALDARERGQLDVRPIATSRSDLRARVEKGALRRDLWFHLAAVRAQLPPLRERTEDVPLLVRALAAELGHPHFALAPTELAPLRERAYPGNVRELRLTLEGALASRAPAQRAASQRPPGMPPLPPSASLDYRAAKEQVLDAFERAYVADLLAAHEGNVSRAAAAAGLDRNHLAKLAKKHGIR